MILCPLCRKSYPSTDHDNSRCLFSGNIGSYTVNTELLLGAGENSLVFSASRGTAEYALKLFRPNLDLLDPVDQKAFIALCQRYRLLEDLTSRYKVAYFENDIWRPEKQEIPYLVLEKGVESLQYKLLGIDTQIHGSLHNSFRLEEALPWFLQIAEGLKDFHDNKLVHGNICPSNILFTEDSIKLSDSAPADWICKDEYSLPNRGYRTPTREDDLFAFSVTMFQTLFGTVDFINNKHLITALPDDLAHWFDCILWRDRVSENLLEEFISFCSRFLEKGQLSHKISIERPTGSPIVGSFNSQLPDNLPVGMKWIPVPSEDGSPRFFLTESPVTNEQFGSLLQTELGGDADLPVTMVDLSTIELFFDKLTSRIHSECGERFHVRLASSEEWEYAARAKGSIHLSKDTIENNISRLISNKEPGFDKDSEAWGDTCPSRPVTARLFPEVKEGRTGLNQDLANAKRKLFEILNAKIETAYQLFSKLNLFHSAYENTCIDFFSDEWFKPFLFEDQKTEFTHILFHTLMELAGLEIFPGGSGTDICSLSAYAWYNDETPSIQPVKRKKPNNWGLYDMFGNVWEITCTIPSPEAGQTSYLSQRIARGGSFCDGLEAMQIYRSHRLDASRGYQNVGFRCLLEITE